MARKPNYQFERNARAKAKAEKREGKRLAKLAAKVEKQPDESITELDDEARQDDTATNEAAQHPAD